MTPIERARKLRREMSPAEIALWLVLRDRPGGFKFRRQRPSDPATLDFFCYEAGLAIEVDGDAHDFEERAIKDVARDAMMRRRGVKTVRIPAVEVFRNLQGVVNFLVEECASRCPPRENVRTDD